MLPLLSQALTLTWERREGDRLTREGYDRAGRVAGAVEVSAEAVYAGLTEDQQAIARDVLRRMTAVGHDGRPARRPLSRAELRAGRPKNQRAEAGAVLDAFARSRLVVLAPAPRRSRTTCCCNRGRGCGTGWRRISRA